MMTLSNNISIDIGKAEDIAIQAIQFLSADTDRLISFFNTTGLSIEQLRDNINSHSFLSGILEYLLTDESLLLAFCANNNLNPAIIAPTKSCLEMSSDNI